MRSALSGRVRSELAKPWYHQGSPILRKLYKRDREVPRRASARFTMWTASFIYLAFSALDLYLVPDVADLTIMARIVLSLVSVLLIEAQIRMNAKADWIDGTCAAIIVAAYATWLSTAERSLYEQNFLYYTIFGVVFMMVSNLLFTFTARLSSLISSAILILFSQSLLFHYRESSTYDITYLVFFASSFALTICVNIRLNLERYNVFLNALQSKIQQDEVVEQGKNLLRMSNTDSLTGLWNRRGIDERLKSYWAEWAQARKGFAIVLIDIDFFKKYNDSFGHQEGDNCLVGVAGALAALMRARGGDAGRFGGEEFIVVGHADGDAGVCELAEEIRRSVEALRVAHDRRPDGERVVTVSVGAAFSDNLVEGGLDRLVNEADRALYRAKAAGRNCVRVCGQIDADGTRDVASLLGRAIDDQLVSLVFQPIRNAISGRIEAAEALMRLKTPGGEMVPPGTFIPVAERTGDIVRLGRWALRSALIEFAETNVVVSVNVSPVQLKSPGFAISVASILGETGVHANRVAFEITEGYDIDSDPQILRCLAELKQLGIRIWLDDFGTGFAGLSCLRAFEFDAVKIDRSFLQDSSHLKGAVMLQDIIRLISHRGQTTIVEGIETEEQLNLMRSYGIDRVQGFHLGRPTTGEACVPRPIPIEVPAAGAAY